MASDGKVTITIDLDGNRARGEVKSLKSLLMGLGDSSSKSFGTGSKSALGFGTAVAIASKAVSVAMGAISSSMGGAISRVDTMNRFPKMMQAMGFSADDAKGSVDALAKGIDGLPTALDEVVATTQQLALMNGDLGKSTKLTLALNDAFLASGSSAADASRGLVQFSQMMSTGKVDMQSWKTLMETMPLGLQKTAEAFGFAGASAKNDLYQALKDGVITFDQFSDKLIELDGGINGFAELARINSIGIATSFKNVQTAVVRGTANMIQAFDKAAKAKGLGGIAENMDKVKKAVSKAFDTATPYVEKFIDLVVELFNTMERNGAVKALSWALFSIQKAASSLFEMFTKGSGSTGWILMASHAIETLGKVIGAIGQSVNKFIDAFNKTDAVTNFKLAVEDVLNAIEKIANAVQKSQVLAEFGRIFGEVVSQISKAASAIGEFISSLDPSTLQIVVDGVLTAIAAIQGMKMASNVIGGLVNGFNILRAAITGHPILTLAVIIAGLVGAFMSAYNSNEQFRSAVDATVKTLSDLGKKIGEFLSGIDPSIFALLIPVLGTLLAKFKAFDSLGKINPFKLFKKNADDAANGVGASGRKAKGVITQIFNGLSNVIKSSGNAIKSAATGIGTGLKSALTGLSTVIKAFGAALKTAGVANILAFGGAVAIAAVGIGAGVAIIAAGFALLASQSQGVATIINAVGEAFATVATAVIGAFAQAIVTVSGVLPTVTSALAELAPLVVAFGEAFAAAAPFVTSLGEAITSIISVLPPVIDAFSQGAATIIEAVTPIVDIVGNVFVSVAQIIADAVVQIVQALAPFMPAVSEMVQSLAPVLQSIVEAFTALINQISPIIDSIANLFTSLGNSIKTVLDGAKGVIEGFGNAVKSILDGISGIFDSIGNAALNAGKGFKLLAQGVVMITNTKLGDMAASLAAVATGVGAISAVSGGMASAGTGMKSLGQGMVMVGTAGTGASGALGALAGIVPTISSTLSALGPTVAVAGAAMRTFAASAVASFIGLSASAGHLTAFNSSLTSLQSAIATVSASVTMFGSYLLSMTNHAINASTNILRLGTAVYQMQAALYQTSSATLSVGQSLLTLKSMASSAMSGMVAAIGLSMAQAQAIIRRASQEFVRSIASIIPLMKQSGMQAGQGSGQGVSAGIMSTIGLAVAAMNAMIAAVRSAGLSGVGSMHYIGAMIGQGLAQGMYSALGAVTAAANALVAQAERAAQAKAKIHSPSRLFRDNVGRYISQGVAVGILADAYKVDDAMGNMYDQIQSFNFKAEDVIGVGKSKLSKVVQIKSDLENAIKAKVESTKDKANELVEKALDIAERAVERPVETYLDGDTLVARTGDRQRAYQENQTKIYNRMRGIDK